MCVHEHAGQASVTRFVAAHAHFSVCANAVFYTHTQSRQTGMRTCTKTWTATVSRVLCACCLAALDDTRASRENAFDSTSPCSYNISARHREFHNEYRPARHVAPSRDTERANSWLPRRASPGSCPLTFCTPRKFCCGLGLPRIRRVQIDATALHRRSPHFKCGDCRRICPVPTGTISDIASMFILQIKYTIHTRTLQDACIHSCTAIHVHTTQQQVQGPTTAPKVCQNALSTAIRPMRRHDGIARRMADDEVRADFNAVHVLRADQQKSVQHEHNVHVQVLMHSSIYAECMQVFEVLSCYM